MSATIELRALVGRDGRYLLVRDAGGEWALPGGVFSDDFEDVDAAMDSLLRELGVVCEDVSGAFVETAYIGNPPDVVLNLYAPAEWMGVAVAPTGQETGWFAPEELGLVGLAPGVADAVLAALGLQPRTADAAILGRSEEQLRAPQTPTPTLPRRGRRQQSAPFLDRRKAGLDVLRTLGATADPEGAMAAMAARTPEIAGDVVDFALGEVWSHPALDRRTRSLQVVAMLSALGGRAGPLRSHINGALNHGATPEQVVQTLRMVAVYAGFPAALEAWPIMEEVFKARGIERAERPS